MKTKVLVVADDPGFEHWLESADDANLDAVLIRGTEPSQLLQAVAAQSRYDMVFCEFTSANAMLRASFVEQFHERHWQIPVVGLGNGENAECLLAAMRAGARDFLVRGRDDATLGSQINRLLKRSAASTAAVAPARSGQIFLTVSGHPHESIAFFAEHLALAIAEKQGPADRVLLVDLATPSGAAAIFLNLNPTYNVLDAVNDAHRCDQTLIDTAFPKHSSGLYVLSLPEDLLGRGSFEPEQLLKLMQVLRGLFAYTVVAIDGHAPIAAVAGLVDMADRTLLLSDQSILKSRHNKYLLRALRAQDCSLERASLVVDNYRRRLGLEPRNLAELFELPLLTALHTESFNRLLSMNSGEPLFTLVKKDPYCGDVRDLATTLLSGDMKPVAQQQGFLDRLLR
ncbi:MAG: AAA family ATPase [Nevskia sp.]|jgi:pilus assembly protein CpaE|uniref:AAA family ATPase n=1 Tax=Nevskia sp. TaxID=1929292 RepID=UPI0040356C85